MEKSILKLTFGALLAALSGCGSFDPGSLINDTRVLGARIEVQGDTERASPRPGETADIRFVVAAPSDARPMLSWAFVACIDSAAGLASCKEQPVAFVQGEGTPELSLTVPDEATLGEADNLQLLGVVCDGGTPKLDDEGAVRCEGNNVKTSSLKLDVKVARDEQLNRNPSLTDIEIALDEGAWRADSSQVAAGGCSDEDVPQVKANGKKHELTIELGADVRERYRAEDGSKDVLEGLQLSHFVTAGELDSQYSFVEPGDPVTRTKLEVEWTAPEAKDVPQEGELVRLVLVVRDLRGGLAVTERSLCAQR